MAKEKIVLVLLMAFTCLPFLVSGIQINEIMYNPVGADDNKEFVEIKGTNNLSGFVFGDLSGNDTLELLAWKDSNYSLIVEEGFDYSGLDCSVYSAGASIGNNLNNQEEQIFLYRNSLLEDTVFYDNSLGNGNGHTLEYFNNSWQESLVLGGTPCMPNSIIPIIFVNQTINHTVNNSANYSVNQSTNFTFNQSLNQTTNLTVPEINTTSNDSQNLSGQNFCNVSIGVETQKTFFENKEKIEFFNTLTIKEFDFEIEYWIEDSQGDIVKSKRTTTNTNKKSYTPSIKQKEQALVIKNRIVFVDCENLNNRTSSEKVVVVSNPDFEEECNCDETLECEESEKETQHISEKEKASIRSFYTRNKIIGEEINLYSGIEGNGFYELYLYSLHELNSSEFELEKSSTAKFSVPVVPGKNTFFVELIDQNKTLDFEKLEVFREYEKEKSEKETKIPNSEEPQSKEQSKNQNNTDPDLLISPEKNQNSITGNTVAYESKDSKVKKYLNYGLVVVFVVGIMIFLKGKINGRNNKKNKRKAEADGGLGKGKDFVRNSWKAQRTHSKNS